LDLGKLAETGRAGEVLIVPHNPLCPVQYYGSATASVSRTVPSTASPGPSGTHLGYLHLVAGGGNVPAGIELNIR